MVKEVLTTPRNNWMRKYSDMLVLPIASLIYQIRPHTTADEITQLGPKLGRLGINISLINSEAERPNKTLTYLSAGAIITSMLVDLIDGAYATYLETYRGIPKDPNGALVDHRADRECELDQDIAHFTLAQRNKSSLGQVTAVTLALLSPVPGYLRARCEDQGKVTRELDWGASTVRRPVVALGTVFPKLQPYTDSLALLGTIITIFKRYKILNDQSYPQQTLDEAAKDKAAEKVSVAEDDMNRAIVVITKTILFVKA